MATDVIIERFNQAQARRVRRAITRVYLVYACMFYDELTTTHELLNEITLLAICSHLKLGPTYFKNVVQKLHEDLIQPVLNHDLVAC